jgi:hypothetical protein
MNDVYMSVLLGSLCSRISEPEFCDYAYFWLRWLTTNYKMAWGHGWLLC